MNNRRILITEDERERILRMHENHAKRNNLNFGRLNEATVATPKKPETTIEVRAFQDFLDDRHPGWYNGGNMDSKERSGYGTFGPYTTNAWNSYGTEYLNNFYNTENFHDIDPGKTMQYKLMTPEEYLKNENCDMTKPYGIMSKQDILDYTASDKSWNGWTGARVAGTFILYPVEKYDHYWCTRDGQVVMVDTPRPKSDNTIAAGGGGSSESGSSYLKNSFTKAAKTGGITDYDPTNMVIKNVPGGKIFLVSQLSTLTPEYKEDESGKHIPTKFDTSKLELTGEYVNANKYALEKGDVTYDDVAATGGSVPPLWYTDNGNVYSVVVHNGVAYGYPNNENFTEYYKITKKPPVDATPKKGAPPTMTTTTTTIAQQQTDQEEVTAIKDVQQATQEFNQGKGDLRKLKKVRNQLERILKRKDKFMDDKTKQTYQNSIADLDNKIKQLGQQQA